MPVISIKKLPPGFLLVTSLLFAQSLYAQDVQKVFRKGEHFFEAGNYVRAIELFESIADSSNLSGNQIATYLAQSYLKLLEPLKALKALTLVNDPNDFNIFLQAETYYYTEQFERALTSVNQVVDTNYFEVNTLRKKIITSSFNYRKSKGFIVQNFGEQINSTDREYSAVMFNHYNKLLFTSRGKSAKNADKDGLDYENISATTIDSANNWITAQPLKMSLEQERTHDATVQVYNNGQKLISYHDGHLFVSVLKNETWSKEGKLQIHKYDGSDTHCFISDNEKNIIFASDLASPGNDLDLYYSSKDDEDKWTVPIPISELNTSYDEDAPFISKDGSLYFSSRGHNSMGGYDVFKSSYDSTTRKWLKPVNLGHPINTVSEDIYYTTDGKLGYISSSRLHGQGSLDLYRVYLFNKVKINGYVIDEENNQPIPDVQIELEYDSLYFKSYTDINGKYEMFVPINQKMSVSFTKDSTCIYEDNYIVNVFFKDKNNNEYNFQINNSKNHPEAIANFETSKDIKELKINVKNDLKPDHKLLAIPKHLDKLWVDSATQSNDLQRMAYLAQLKLQEQKKDTIKLIVYFRTGSHTLSKSDKELLDTISKKKIAGSINISGHSDNSGNAKNNIKLSILRARSVFDYLASKGINPKQMIYKGYGSSLPLDTKDILTPEKLRRTEIIYYE